MSGVHPELEAMDDLVCSSARGCASSDLSTLSPGCATNWAPAAHTQQLGVRRQQICCGTSAD